MQRYPTDLTEAEWTLLTPLIPAAKPGGRPRTTDMREVRPVPLATYGAVDANGACSPPIFRPTRLSTSISGRGAGPASGSGCTTPYVVTGQGLGPHAGAECRAY